jgi:SAM-dependent methyltransferase
MPPPGFNEFLHALRTDALRTLPPGARTFLSAGCSGGWYFDWIAANYPGLERHVGVELYSQRPDTLPANAEWISNSVADMRQVPDVSVDLLFSGQNLEHLPVADVPRFLCEARRVLRPGGWLGLAWHSWSDRSSWLRELGEVVGTPEMVWDPERPRWASELDGFAAAENRQFGLEQVLDVEQVVALASSWSPVAVRDDRDAVLDAVRALATRTADAEGRVVFGYVTDCYRYRRA